MLINLHSQATTTPKVRVAIQAGDEEVLQSHHFRSGEELEATLHRYVRLYNQQLPQLASSSKTPLQAMKDLHKLKHGLFKKQLYHLPGCDTYAPDRRARSPEVVLSIVFMCKFGYRQ